MPTFAVWSTNSLATLHHYVFIRVVSLPIAFSILRFIFVLLLFIIIVVSVVLRHVGVVLLCMRLVEDLSPEF